MNTLNSAQKQAVEYVSGPLLIVAGAGTGKTTVITRKIAYLIEQKLAKPEEILALTFTDKAAGEMQERVDKLVNLGYTDLQISTFHAFCQRLLENYGLQIGLPNEFNLLTQTDAWLLVRQNLHKFNLDYYRPLGNPTKHIHELIKHFSKCKDELITPDEYLKHAENLKLNTDKTEGSQETEIKRINEVADAYHIYNQLLLDNNSLDFGDLIFYTIKLLKERPNVLKLLQAQYKYILVDEFQDVNWAQYQLTQMIVGDHGQLTVVGDDDQSIYAFRGASVSNILRFKNDYPKAKEIVLTENYRSEQAILDLAYKLIQNNNPDRLEVKLKIDKKLTACCHPDRPAQGGEAEGSLDYAQDDKQVIHIHQATLDQEVNGVIEEIQKIKISDPEATWDNFAILVRANNHATPFINRLQAYKIPYEFLASDGLYRQPIVLDCVNFLKLVDNYHESTAIFRLLNAPFWSFEASDLQKLTLHAKKKTTSFYDLLKQAQILDLSKNGLEIATKLVSLIQTSSQSAKTEKTSVLLYKFLQDSGYLTYLAHEENQGNTQIIRQIYQLKQFFDNIQARENANPEHANVQAFLDYYQMILESGDKGELYRPTDTPDSVNILTIHGAKGLEFKYVFVVNLVEDRFPTRKRSDGIEIPLELIKEQLPEGDEHIEEERRLFYVAITRAKKRIYLTSAGDYGGSREKKISRFLAELDFVVTEKIPKEKLTKNLAEINTTTETTDPQANYPLPDVFSFSQIKAYDNCPYQYKLANILKLPTKGSGIFSFGQSLHSTLQKFYQQAQELNQSEQSSLFGPVKTNKKEKTIVPTLEELLKIYRAEWICDWYKDKWQKDTYFKKGKEILETFYQDNETSVWTIPITLEGWFKIKVGDNLLHGRIDRIDKLQDGSLEIIDYKTGQSKEKLTAEDKEQLLIYQMATSQLPEYKNLGSVQKLTFYYLNDNIKLTFLGTDKEIAKIQEKIINIINKIYAREFTATPSEHVCKHCDFNDICEFRN